MDNAQQSRHFRLSLPYVWPCGLNGNDVLMSNDELLRYDIQENNLVIPDEGERASVDKLDLGMVNFNNKIRVYESHEIFEYPEFKLTQKML